MTDPARQVLVIGASRGLGLEFVRQYRAGRARVVATARDDAGLARIAALGAKPLRVDLADAASAAGLAWQVDGEAFDTVIVNAGVYGPATQGLQPPTAADFDAVMHANVLGAMRALAAVADALAPGAKLGVMSSSMASIAARPAADAWTYRASKAALNSVLKDASIALAGRATCLALDPGWVRTDMGGASAPLAPEDAVAGLRRVLAAATPERSGSFLTWRGETMPW
ncbi:MAG: SDR family oxidoreductase [Burkholderiaceae bacterium]